MITLMNEQRVLLYQAETLYEFSRKEPEITEPLSPIHLPLVKGEIRFENVSFHYPGRSNVFESLNLKFRPGEKTAIVGTSGNGKTTMLKLINRFYDPREGEILLDGVPLKDISLELLRELIGYVSQETYLFGYSIAENIRFGKPDATDEEIVLAAKSAYAHDFITRLPDGYETLVGERGGNLSGGQKQRISLARMFIKNPAIILLDEATSSLDNISEMEVKMALSQLRKGRTTVVVAHRLSTIMDADTICVLDKGKVVETGTYQELLDKRGVFHKLVNGEGNELFG
ncbi:putative multidrug export ATP-binding/permease protein [compost metagenome]